MGFSEDRPLKTCPKCGKPLTDKALPVNDEPNDCERCLRAYRINANFDRLAKDSNLAYVARTIAFIASVAVLARLGFNPWLAFLISFIPYTIVNAIVYYLVRMK